MPHFLIPFAMFPQPNRALRQDTRLRNAEHCWELRDVLTDAECLSWVWLLRWAGAPA